MKRRRLRTKGEWRKLERAVLALGWSVDVTRGNHVAFTAPDGRRVYCPGTPGERRGYLNTRAELRRLGVDC